MSYLDGIDISSSVNSAAAIRAIRATRPMSALQARGLIAASIGALERANADDDEFIDITVKRLDLIGQLSNMDKRLAQARDGVIPERAAAILRDVACDAIDEFDAAADDVASLAAQRDEVVSEVLGAAAISSTPSEPSKVLVWAKANPWRTGAIVAGVVGFGLALFSAHALGRSRR